jgi:hypothetical protein
MADALPKRDFKYGPLLASGPKMAKVLKKFSSIRSPHLRDCAKAFSANIGRTGIFALMPAEVAFRARRDHSVFNQAIFNTTGKLPKLGEFLGGDPPTGYQEELKKLDAEYFSLSRKTQRRLRNAFGIGYVVALLTFQAQMRESMDAMFASIIFESWTAFECLAGDAWIATVNHAPKKISTKVASSRFSESGDVITPKSLNNLGYDLNANFGRFLVDTKRFSFLGLGDIINAYAALFDVRDDRATLGTFNRVSKGYIFALSAIRNLLVHKSGKVNEEFIGRVRRFRDFGNVVHDEQLLLNGEMVATARLAAVSVGLALLKKLDNILSPVQPKP